MPRRFLRVLVVVLLSLMVPAQGVAAVVAGQCMVFGHHQDAGAHGDGHAQAEGHDHAAVLDDEGGANAHCGPCAACCASASIVQPTSISILSSSSNTKYLFSQAPPPGVEPQRLDRPPLAL